MSQLLGWFVLITVGASLFVAIIRFDEWMDARKERSWKR
jgi:hypothetical protein